MTMRDRAPQEATKRMGRLGDEGPLALFGRASGVVRFGRPEVLGALALVCVYVAVMSGHIESIDGRLMFQQGMSLAYDHSLHFRQAVATAAGPYWTSKYGIGLSLLYIPTLLLASLLFPGLATAAQTDPSAQLWPLYAVAGAPVQIAIVASTALVIGMTVRRLGGGAGLSLLGMAAFGLASPALVYARMDGPQALLGLCVIAGIWAAVSYRETRDSRWLILAAAAQCLAILARPIEGVLLVPVLLVLARSLPGVVAISLGLVAGVAGTLAVNWGRYGSPLITGYGVEGFSTPPLTGLSGSLFSPGRGILWAFPAVILLPMGASWLWRVGRRDAALALPGFCIALLLEVSTWDVWWGGYNWGPRLYVPALPVLALLAALGAASLRHWPGLLIVVVLLVAGAIWAAPAVVTDIGAGYGAMADKTAGSWKLAAYPPLGAWAFMQRWLGFGINDTPSANVLWLRLAQATGGRLLLIPAALTVIATWLGWLALRRAGVSLRGGGNPDTQKIGEGGMSRVFAAVPSSVAGRLRALVLLALSAVALLPAWQNLTGWLDYGRTQLFRTDLALYYVFSRIGLTYGWNRLYDLSAQKHVYDSLGSIWWFPLPYTPPMAWLTAPLTILPLQAAYWVWAAVIAAAWVTTWWLTAPRDLPLRLLCLVAPLALYMVYLGLSLGQVIVLQMLSVALCYWLLQRGQEVWAGIALLGVLIHPQSFFVVPLVVLLAGHWKAFAAFAIAAAAVAAVVLLSLGTDGIMAYADRLHQAQVNPNMFWVSPWISLPMLLAHHPTRALLIQVTLVAMALVAAWRSRGRQLEPVLAMGLICSTLVTSFIHLDDLMVLVLAAWLTLRVWPQLWSVAVFAVVFEVALLQTHLGTPRFGRLIVGVELAWVCTLALLPVPTELVERVRVRIRRSPGTPTAPVQEGVRG